MKYDNVISVGMSLYGEAGIIYNTPNSNRSGYMDPFNYVSALGTDISVIVSNGDVINISGTSPAAMVVTSEIALLYEADPTANYHEIIAAVTMNTEPVYNYMFSQYVPFSIFDFT
jgi:hypothetical protein